MATAKFNRPIKSEDEEFINKAAHQKVNTKDDDDRTDHTSIRFKKVLLNRIDAARKADGVSRSAWVSMRCAEYLRKLEQEQKI